MSGHFILVFTFSLCFLFDQRSLAVDLQNLTDDQLLKLQKEIQQRLRSDGSRQTPTSSPPPTTTPHTATAGNIQQTISPPQSVTLTNVDDEKASTAEATTKDTPTSLAADLRNLTDDQLLTLRKQIHEWLLLDSTLKPTPSASSATGQQATTTSYSQSVTSTSHYEQISSSTKHPTKGAARSLAVNLQNLTDDQLLKLQKQIQERLRLDSSLTSTPSASPATPPQGEPVRHTQSIGSQHSLNSTNLHEEHVAAIDRYHHPIYGWIDGSNRKENKTLPSANNTLNGVSSEDATNAASYATTETTNSTQASADSQTMTTTATMTGSVAMRDGATASQSAADESNIGRDRVTTIKGILSGYEKYMPPPLPIINVTLKVKLNALIGLDAHSEEATYLLWFHLEWNDPRLIYTPLSSPNATLNVPQDMIWRPDIMIQNIVEATYPARYSPPMYAIIKYDGTVAWTFPVVAITYCDMNTKAFPSDTQKCPIIVTSWSHDNAHINLQSNQDDMKSAYYREDSEWQLIETTIDKENVKYSVSDHPFSQVTFWVSFKRGSLYYHAYLVFPGFMIALLSIMGLFTPSSSDGVRSEKVTFGITVMLTLAIFLLLMAEYTAKTSDNFPRLGIFFIFIIAMIALGTVMATIILIIERRGLYNTPFPDNLRPFISKKVPNKEKVPVNPDLIEELRYKASKKYRTSIFGDKIWPDAQCQMGSPYEQSNTFSTDQESGSNTPIPDGRTNHKRNPRHTKREKLGCLLRKAVRELQNLCDSLSCRDTRCYPDEWHRLASMIDLICFIVFTIILFISVMTLFLSLL